MMQLVAVPFESSRRKIARAKQHINDLKARAKAFGEEHPYEEFRRKDSENRRIVIGARLTKPFPDCFDDIASDAMNNLRDALDHACYAVAVAVAPTKRIRSATFPFAVSEAALENQIKGRCRDVPEQLYPLFRSFKPYDGGDDLLCALNKICNRNKHAFLVPMGTGGLVMEARLHASREIVVINAPIWDSSKDEIEFAYVPPDTHLKYEIKCGFTVTFPDIDAIRGQEAFGVLDASTSKVESIVLAIEAEGIRLGLVN
jgi:hypothetical protein